jgi:hypothetical protein
MSHLRQYGIILLIVITVAILVLIRATATDRFKHDAQKLAKPSFSHANILSREQLASLTSGYLIIDLNDQGNPLVKHPGDSIIQLAAGLLLTKKGQEVLRSHKIPILLYSSEPTVSARAWMLLSQMGYRNLFILADEPENETIRYKFRPDTTRAGIIL